MRRFLMPQIGMNLALYGTTYFGVQYPFLDRFRTADVDNWDAISTAYTRLGHAAVKVNAATGLPAQQDSNVLMIEFGFNIDPAPMPMTDRYVVTWKGAADFNFRDSTIVSRGDHQLVFEYKGANNAVVMQIGGLTDADPVRDIHIVREDQLAAFDAGQVFSPDFLAKASQWSTLRFMDWGLTNGNQAVEWSDLASNDSVSWGGAKGVPLKVMVDLANAAGTDMWYNIPAHASDDLVRQALTYIRDHLNPNLKLHLEYSNEMWNIGFEQTGWAQAKGLDPATWAAYPGVNPAEMGAGGWYGLRSAQIAHMTDEVFGAQSHARVANVLAPMTFWPGLEAYLLKGIQAANLGSVGDLFEEWAITTYFGNQLGGETDADKAKVLAWARSGSDGLDAAFKDLATGGALSGDLSLVQTKAAETYHANIAKTYGLDLVAYEGGLHVYALGYHGQDQAEIIDFLNRLLADPRMGTLYTQMASDFASVGGKEIIAFNDVGPVSAYGTWGALDNIYQTHSPRYDALVNTQKLTKSR